MNTISIFDIIKIGVGPSSSHTMGPWKAAHLSIKEFLKNDSIDNIESVQVELYGSLAKTGHGHGTDVAVLMGLSGEDYTTMDTSTISQKVQNIYQNHQLNIFNQKIIPFLPEKHLLFNFEKSLPFHPNGVTFRIKTPQNLHSFTYFSIGGGFVVKENEEELTQPEKDVPFPIENATFIKNYCQKNDWKISDLVFQNELTWRNAAEIKEKLNQIWNEMSDCVYRGCHTEGELGGGLKVQRRAAEMNKKLIKNLHYTNRNQWLNAIKVIRPQFYEVLKWVSCFALAVNEENAAFGRIITAPTNGAAGVVPAVLMYYYCFAEEVTIDDVHRFLMVAGVIGIVFKNGATISAAMGGCQAEIGVSSAMAAAALTECLGGTVEQSLMAAEIAMEHHLGMTCDPIGGLVQIPCIERNTMGAVKAITAANIALESDPSKAKVSLDDVVKTMWETAQDMNTKYKETSEGGLAVSVNVSEC